MSRNQSKFFAYFITLVMLMGFWVPFTASAMMVDDHQMAHEHAADGASSLHTSHALDEPACSICDGNMGDHSNCTESCCQSCVHGSGVATFIKLPDFPVQDISVKPRLPVATNLSVHPHLLERPPIFI